MKENARTILAHVKLVFELKEEGPSILDVDLQADPGLLHLGLGASFMEKYKEVNF